MVQSTRTAGDGQPERQCTSCLAWLSPDAFGKAKKGPDGLNWSCRECCRDREQARRDADPEAHREAVRRYGERHPELVRLRKQVYYYANWEARREKTKTWQRQNPERVAEHKRREYENNRDRYIEQARQYRTRKRDAEGNFTRSEFRALCEAFNNVCLCCGEPGSYLTFHADHVVPLSRGGSNYIQNIQPLCALCNGRKYTRTVDYRGNLESELGGEPCSQ